ncbi:MAG TPA: hypothetical protein VLW45_10930 [Pelomicrobium sp.]|nr:hypothetical protein [Pelomicrobium sp.]
MRKSLALCLLAVFVLAACAQSHPTVRYRDIDLPAGALEKHGIAFITPSTVTGQEEEKQAVALTFAEVLKRERPQVRVVTLAETLGAVNRAGLAEAYREMYADYRDTGLFKRDTLAKVGDLAGTRYVAQLKLQGFEQGEKERFGALGFRIVETKHATVRLFFQIWDTDSGTIAWEGIEELRISTETWSEEQVTLTRVMERAAEDLIAKLP